MTPDEKRERHRAAQARWFAKDPEKARRIKAAAQARYKARHPDRSRENLKIKAWRKAHPEEAFAQSIRKYNLSLREYHSLLAAQKGRCAICRRVPGTRRFHIDHDHACCPGHKSCGECVRGLLCGDCNTQLPIIERGLAARASDYLQRPPYTPSRMRLFYQLCVEIDPPVLEDED